MSKLKILPPTLRITNHYLILDVKSEVSLDKDDMVPPIWDACIRFWGECETSNFNLWVMRHYLVEECDGFMNYKTILRCQSGYEEKVRAGLATLTRYNHNKIAISTIGIAGTIKSAIDKFIEVE